MSCGGGHSGWLLDYGLVEEEIQGSDFIYMVDDPPVSSVILGFDAPRREDAAAQDNSGAKKRAAYVPAHMANDAVNSPATPRNGDGDANAAAAAAAAGAATSPTRPRGRSRGRSVIRRGGNEVVVHERVVQERTNYGSSIVYPTLTSTNYIEWALVMKINLRAQGLWEAVSGVGTAGDREDMAALSALLRAVPPEMVPVLAVKDTAADAWEAIKLMRMGVSRAREATAQRLRKEFEQITFKDGESLDAFGMRITNLANNLRSLGDIVDEVKIVQKFLREVPAQYAQIACSIETLLDLDGMSVEELIGRLRSSAERCSIGAGNGAGSQLLLTEEQWRARGKKKEHGSGSNGGGGKWSGHDKQKGRDGDRRSSNGERGNRDMSGIKCYNCNKFAGHISRDCPEPRRERKGQQQANLAKAEEEDKPVLHLARVCSLSDDEGPSLLMAALSDEVREAPRVPISAPICVDTVERVDIVEDRVFLAKEDQGDDTWFLDTGASNHMTGRRAAFAELNTNVGGTVKFGDGSVVEIEGRGTVLFACGNGEHRALTDVYFIPRLKSNIVSLGQLDERGCQVLIGNGHLRLHDRRGRLLAKVPRARNRLYIVTLKLATPVCLAAHHDNDAWRWHARFGHLNFDALRKLARKDMVRGMPRIDHVEQLCEACLAGKQRRAPFPQQAKKRAQGLLDLVHGDLCGPITPATPGGKRYFLLLVDDQSRYMWLTLLATKDQAAAAIMRFKAGVEVETGRKLRLLRTDRGGEFTVATFAAYCAEEGIGRQLTAPYSPQQNGVVERRNQTIVAAARSLMKAKEIPARFWGEAVTTAVYLLNRSPTKSVEGRTPFEAWHGYKPDVSYLRVFGCVAHVKITKPNAAKLDDRSTPMVFFGYEPGSAAYRVFDPAKNRVHVTRDVIFDEGSRWDWEKTGTASDGAHFSVDFFSYPVSVERPTVVADREAVSPVISAAPTVAVSSPPPPNSVGGGDTSAHSDGTAQENSESELRTPSEPPRHRMITRARDGIVKPNTIYRDYVMKMDLQPEEEEEQACLAAAEEPDSVSDALGEKCWKVAMDAEIAAIESNDTWEYAELPRGHRAIGLKWVYKVKRDPAGNIVKHKARLVAKGYAQQQGVDYDEVYAPVARMETIRLLLAVAAHCGWSVHHMDVKSAFLNGDLREEVYVHQPPGYINDEQQHAVLRLRKALYGLRQAPRAWNSKLDSSLAALGFERSPHEHAVYRRSTATSTLIVGVYVDDLVITGPSNGDIDKFKEEMKDLFAMSDLGPLSYYLGLEVVQSDEGITICQSAYVDKILEVAGMTGCNATHTPMESRLKLSKEATGAAVDVALYRSVVGSLRYLCNTRPDITYAVGIVSRFLKAPAAPHWAAVKQILRYISGTPGYGCWYKRGEGKASELIGFSDSDYAGDVDDRRSTTGIVYILNGSTITWASQKQKMVTLSSCEAEYVAAASAACQGVWLSNLLGELINNAPLKVKLRVDNMSAIALSKNPVHHERSKHIDVKFHFLRENIENGKIDIGHVSTDGQLADILTKALGRTKFVEMRSKLGVVKVSSVRQV